MSELLLEMYKNLAGQGISGRLKTYAATEVQDIQNLNVIEKMALLSHSLAVAAWEIHRSGMSDKTFAIDNFTEMMAGIMMDESNNHSP